MASNSSDKSPGTTICSLNLNGIRAAERRGFSRWLKRKQPDFLCLQELRAVRDQVPATVHSPVGYNTRWISAQKKGYSGVAIYSKGEVDRYRVGSKLEWSNEEARILRADFETWSLFSIYLPSGSSSEVRQSRKYQWLEHWQAFSAAILKEGRPAVLCGDFNIAHAPIDIHAPKRNEKNSGFLPEERAIFSKLLEQGWVDILRVQNPTTAGLYSWWSNRGKAREKDLGWRIDYCLVTPDLADSVSEAWIEKKADLSDHAPVWLRMKPGVL